MHMYSTCIYLKASHQSLDFWPLSVQGVAEEMHTPSQNNFECALALALSPRVDFHLSKQSRKKNRDNERKCYCKEEKGEERKREREGGKRKRERERGRNIGKKKRGRDGGRRKREREREI